MHPTTEDELVPNAMYGRIQVGMHTSLSDNTLRQLHNPIYGEGDDEENTRIYNTPNPSPSQHSEVGIAMTGDGPGVSRQPHSPHSLEEREGVLQTAGELPSYAVITQVKGRRTTNSSTSKTLAWQKVLVVHVYVFR